jgi:NADPH2:quinone reductase
MTGTMRAVVLTAPGPVSALQIREVPIPVPRPGWVLMRVRAFGLNRSELHTRLGLADGVTFPRVPGIEAAGEIALAPGGEFAVGQKAVTLMGGMGRVFDGGYAEYAAVPAEQVIPFTSDLPWEVIGALPEMLQTAYGCLRTGLDFQPGQTLLVRGGTTSVGMMSAILAKRAGLRVFSTTRSPGKADRLRAIGVDEVLIDDGRIARRARELAQGGADIAIELVGTPTLRDTLQSLRVHGTACFAGMVSNEWVVPDFYPIEYIPRGVRLTAYGGDYGDLPGQLLQSVLDDLAAGTLALPIDRVYRLDEIAEAHQALEDGTTLGKQVVLT